MAENYLHKLNSAAELLAFGQEINDQTFAICKADMLIKGNDATQIRSGNTLSDDQFAEQTFDYTMIEKLIEYKKSLIYEAVTGKLEV